MRSRSPIYFTRVIPLASLLWTLATIAYALPGDRIGSEFQVNTITSGPQVDPAIASDPTGNFIVVWSSQTDVRGQRYSSSGTSVGGELQINSFTRGDQAHASVTSTNEGGFIATWESTAQDGSALGIFARRFASHGAFIGSEFQANTFTAGDQAAPTIAADHSGSVVIAWQSASQDGSSDGIFAQGFASDGSRVGSEFQVNTSTAAVQSAPSIAADRTGRFIVAWQSADQDGSGGGIFSRPFARSGLPFGPEVQVNTGTSLGQSRPHVTSASNGSYVILWQREGSDGSSLGTSGRRYASSGNAVGNEFEVNRFTAGVQSSAAIAMDPNGGFTAVWNDKLRDGRDEEVFGRRFNSEGVALGREFQINSFTSGAQRDEVVASDLSGGFVVTWHSQNQDGDSDGIFAQRFAGESQTVNAAGPTVASADSRTPASCPFAPASGCVPSGRQMITIKNTGNPNQNRFEWQYMAGTATKEKLGNPKTGTSYAVCVYRERTKVVEAVIPGGGQWKELTSGFKYRRSPTTGTGISEALLKVGTKKAKFIVNGRGSNLALPQPPLVPAGSVTVQLINDPASGGNCWESVFAPPYRKNVESIFKGKD